MHETVSVSSPITNFDAAREEEVEEAETEKDEESEEEDDSEERTPEDEEEMGMEVVGADVATTENVVSVKSGLFAWLLL